VQGVGVGVVWRMLFDGRMNKQDKIASLIIESIASYRRAHANLKDVRIDSPAWQRACEMQMDRAAGAIDVLYDIAPKHKAWRDAEWTF